MMLPLAAHHCSGIHFLTPNINTTTTYYAEAILNSCASSSRVAVTATVYQYYDGGYFMPRSNNNIRCFTVKYGLYGPGEKLLKLL
jgi:hypothetical protein